MPVNTEKTRDDDKIVYVRRLTEDEIENLISEEDLADIDNPDELFALWTDDGEPLAVMQGRDNAFTVARANELEPVSVH